MEFKLGDLNLKAVGFPLFENYLEMLRTPALRDQAPIETLFRWNCATQRGRPNQPLRPFVAKCFMNFINPDPPGAKPNSAAKAVYERWKQAGKFKTDKAFSQAFDRALPDIPFPIDEAKLINPFKPNYVFIVTAFAAYNHFVVRADGGRPEDWAVIAIPWYVYLQTEFIRSCNNAPDPGISGLLETDAGELELNELQQGLNRQYRADLDKAIERH